jgi:predicted nuclease of predicted toxin-antitoxin system
MRTLGQDHFSVVDLFPDSTHINAVGLREADDFVVWKWAKKHGFTVVSKDTDFHHRAIGHPPKIIWLRVRNCETSLITNLLISRYQVIRQFIESETESLLVLDVSGHYEPATNGRNDPATKICISRHFSSKQSRINSLIWGLFERKMPLFS